MHIFTTRVHGYLDYIIAIALIASPFLFRFADGGPAQWVPITLGVFAVIYSLITRYELGAIYVLPMPAHLFLDVLSGILLAASPWLFGFADRVYVPHLVFGIGEIAVAALTQSHPNLLERAREAATGSPGSPRGLRS